MGRARTGSLKRHSDGSFSALITVGPPGSQKRRRVRLVSRSEGGALLEMSRVIERQERGIAATRGDVRAGLPDGDPVVDRFVQVAEEDPSPWSEHATRVVLPRLCRGPATAGELATGPYDRHTRQALAWGENAGLLVYDRTSGKWRLRRRVGAE